MALNTDWKEFLDLLVSCDVEFLVVGAWARAFYEEPRTTGDIGFWVRPSQENAARVVDVVNRVEGPLDGVTVCYLSRKDFIRNKLAVGRPKDLADIDALCEN